MGGITPYVFEHHQDGLLECIGSWHNMLDVVLGLGLRLTSRKMHVLRMTPVAQMVWNTKGPQPAPRREFTMSLVGVSVRFYTLKLSLALFLQLLVHSNKSGGFPNL